MSESAPTPRIIPAAEWNAERITVLINRVDQLTKSVGQLWIELDSLKARFESAEGSVQSFAESVTAPDGWVHIGYGTFVKENGEPVPAGD